VFFGAESLVLFDAREVHRRVCVARGDAKALSSQPAIAVQNPLYVGLTPVGAAARASGKENDTHYPEGDR